LLVAKTLSLSEPGDTEIRVVLPPSSQVEPLNFLIHSSNKPQDCTLHTCKDLRDVPSPDTPRELLQEFLARVTQQVREEGIPFGVNFHEAVAHNAGILAGAVVARYYQRIDRGEPCDITEIVDLFASDATYRRGGEAIVGKEAIKEFFTSTRSLIGSHELRCMTVAGLKVVVEGEFLGSSQCSGENRQISFVDTWRFNTKGRVAQRETYLQTGYRDTI